MKTAGQMEVEEIVNLDADDGEANTQRKGAKDSLERFKFRLSALSEHGLPLLKLNAKNTTDRYNYEAKMGESKSHGKKGTWDVVPLPEGVKPVTSHGVTTDKYGPDG
ncbi:hypothetical protein AFCA_011190 [Aspergillus flavus]|nr:hypothetical protein AFCA_011190 [Aspergillus flavus]